MPRRIKPARLERLVAPAQEDVTGTAAEIAARLYQALLARPELKLLDGTTARVEAYYPPEVDDDSGQVHCGIDVRLAGGEVLEFTLTNTGWERSFAGHAHLDATAPTRKRLTVGGPSAQAPA